MTEGNTALWIDAVQKTEAGRVLSNETLKCLPAPSLCYSEPRLRENLYTLMEMSGDCQDIVFAFAVKACALRNVLETVVLSGLFAEIQSLHEANLVMYLGLSANKIIYNGPRKRRDDIAKALSLGINIIVDNQSEGYDLIDLADRSLPVTWGVRLSIEAETTSKFIRAGDKLGMDIAAAIALIKEAKFRGVEPRILHAHALARASNLEDYKNYVEAIARVRAVLIAETGVPFDIVDVGGGWDSAATLLENGIRPADFVNMVVATLSCGDSPVHRIIFEPGRFVVEDAAFALGRIIRCKMLGGRVWHVVDISINLLIPLPLARFKVVPDGRPADSIVSFCDGTCTPRGVFVRDIPFPSMREGDIVVFGNCGAYTSALVEPFFEPPAPIFWCKSDGADALLSKTQMAEATLLLQGFGGTQELGGKMG